jgi:hypothetical protein
MLQSEGLGEEAGPDGETLFSLTGALGKGKERLAVVSETSAPGDDVLDVLELGSDEEELVGGWGPPAWAAVVWGRLAYF